jgi:hypothetical protein
MKYLGFFKDPKFKKNWILTVAIIIVVIILWDYLKAKP